MKRKVENNSTFLYNYNMIVYVVCINIISFVLMYMDKKRSIYNKWRISEDIFLSLSLVGGSLGIVLSMYMFRHKTRKNKFRILIPSILIIQVYLIIRLFL